MTWAKLTIKFSMRAKLADKIIECVYFDKRDGSCWYSVENPVIYGGGRFEFWCKGSRLIVLTNQLNPRLQKYRQKIMKLSKYDKLPLVNEFIKNFKKNLIKKRIKIFH